MPTCSQITDALNTLASATTNPNILADLSGQTAVLSNIGTTETVVSLSAGGPAVLSMPSSPDLDGVVFRVLVAGKVHAASESIYFTPQIYLGNSSTIANNLNVSPQSSIAAVVPTANDGNFFLELDCIWSSAAGYLGGTTSYFNLNSGMADGQFVGRTVEAQTDLQFVVTGQFNSGNAVNSVTITQFKLQLV